MTQDEKKNRSRFAHTACSSCFRVSKTFCQRYFMLSVMSNVCIYTQKSLAKALFKTFIEYEQFRWVEHAQKIYTPLKMHSTQKRSHLSLVFVATPIIVFHIHILFPSRFSHLQLLDVVYYYTNAHADDTAVFHHQYIHTTYTIIHTITNTLSSDYAISRKQNIHIKVYTENEPCLKSWTLFSLSYLADPTTTTTTTFRLRFVSLAI